MKQFIFSVIFILSSTFGFAQTPPPPPPLPQSPIPDSAGIQDPPVRIQEANSGYVTDTIHSDSTVYTFAGVMPRFVPDGQFYKYLAANIRYPAEEKKKKIQGTVYVSFIIEKDGSVSTVKLVKGIPGGPGLSTEAIRVVSGMPKWIPGEVGGHPARVELVQPVKFVLN